ncbi:MAG: YncE family protein [Chloroflexi bacterium]|nr:MAG: YncE family protein [Chloroflexota bacterium]
MGVGAGPWGVAHNSGNNMVYVANRSDNTVTVINASTRAVVATLSGSFAEPSHVAANPVTGKTYVSNVSGTSVTVIDGAAVSKIVGLTDSTQPYGVAVDETRNLVYVASIDSHRVSVIGDLSGTPDQFLGWAAFHRGFNNPARPVPLRVIAVNPGIGPSNDGGHLWATTSTNDGSEANQALLIPKGWDSYFAMPVARSVGLNPAEGVAVDRTTNRAYVTSGATPGSVSIFSDESSVCLEPFAVSEPEFGFEVQTVP